MKENRGLGFKLAYGESNFAGNKVSPSAYGHTGFTGTSILVCPETNLGIILLTNRINPSRDNRKIIKFRNDLHDLVFLEYKNN